MLAPWTLLSGMMMSWRRSITTFLVLSIRNHLFRYCIVGCPTARMTLFTGANTLRWRHNDHTGVSNHQPHGCLPNRLFRRKSKKTSKLRVTGLCAGNSPGTGEFPAQMASNAENVSIWWRHHDVTLHLDELMCFTYPVNFVAGQSSQKHLSHT